MDKEYNFLPTTFNLEINNFLNNSEFSYSEIEVLFKTITKEFVQKLYAKYYVSFTNNPIKSSLMQGYAQVYNNICEIVLSKNKSIKNNLLKKCNALFTLFHECTHINQDLYTKKPYQTQRDNYYALMSLEFDSNNYDLRIPYRFKLSEFDAQYNACETFNDLIKENVIPNDIEANAVLFTESFCTLTNIWNMKAYDLENNNSELKSNIKPLENVYYKFYIDLKENELEQEISFTGSNLKDAMERVEVMEQNLIETAKTCYNYIVSWLKQNSEILCKFYPFISNSKRIEKLEEFENSQSIKNFYNLALLIKNKFTKIKDYSSFNEIDFESEK